MNGKLIPQLKRSLPLIGASLLFATSVAATVGKSTDYAALPPVTSTNVPGLVMLVMSNDHQLYFKAYTDWDDLDGDGVPEITFKPSVSYYGYFDPSKCYDYDAGDQRFEPKAVTTDPNHYCDGVSGSWSGNFLNWASMTRIDALRKVLYGGTRSTDTSITVLERSFIPTEAHSFAKHYEGADVSKVTPFAVSELTLCNTTYDTSGYSHNSTKPPLIRVAEGDFRYWTANERWQCTWDDERGDNTNGTNITGSATSDPNEASDGLGSAMGGPDFVARVQVCVPGLVGTENCKSYGGDLKPVGLLHTFGEEGQLRFGLLTGSYQKNKSGGVLRKNISNFADEVDSSTGQFTGVDGIVSTIDKLRIARYEYGTSNSDGKYNDGDADTCPWGQSSFAEGNCSNWGNPLSEMYLEAVRYFAGLSANASFAATDSGYISGLTSAAWSDPLDSANWCASCNIVVVNASSLSYDDDALSMADLAAAAGVSTTTAAETKTVGDLEGITGNQYFVGENGTDNNQLCTAKTVDDLADVRGTCPDSPRLSGTYNIAGLAHWAHTNDIRTDVQEDQLINTYSVALSASVPNIRIPVPSTTKEVSILPACRNKHPDPDGNCAIVDFKIIAQDLAAGTGTFFIQWEDTEQGGDYDQDMQGVLSYSISGGSITVATNVLGKSTPHEMGFGYVISGTTQDGFHVHSGINSFDYSDPDVTIADCNDCEHTDGATAETYTIGASSAGLLENPLWYAAKYGGFRDIDDDKTLDSDEWDREDLDGAPSPDGIPDSFFPVTNPNQLEKRLGTVFASILAKVASGTAAAVVTNSSAGDGVLYQAYYQPRQIELVGSENKIVTWVGNLHGIFIDSNGQFREDSDSAGTKGVLDDCGTDQIVTFLYDETEKVTLIQRWNCDGTGKKDTASGLPVPFGELQTVWDARDQLAQVVDAVTQRPMDGTPANLGRHIVTAIDTDAAPDGNVSGSDVVDFIADTFNDPVSDEHRLLNTDDPAEAEKIVNYIRGEEIAGYRNRTLPSLPGTGVWRLGDIIHSTPAAVSAPNDRWFNLYGDTSYREFRDHWLITTKRRQMVYVGANDGMIHAFNGGFYDIATKTLSDPTHPLGSELWAYVPYNLLPHLRWMTEEDYPHIYYMDGEPLVFDANIFPEDDDHVNGWGTVLVVGMRFGGSPIDIDHDDDAGTSDATFQSAYVILDITNPDAGPQLIAEITHPAMNFTTGRPTIVAKRAKGPSNSWIEPSVNEWYLVIGSGPDDLATARSSETAKVLVYDLDTTSGGMSTTPLAVLDTGVAESFIGNLTEADWDRNYEHEAVYFGLNTYDSASSPTKDVGRVMRYHPTSSSLTTLINGIESVSTAPSLETDVRGRHWVHFGTGRIFVEDDKAIDRQQSFYGIREPVDGSGDLTWAPVLTSDLRDTTDVTVYLDKSVDDPGDASITTFDELLEDVRGEGGWVRRLIGLDGTWTVGSGPAPRSVTDSVTLADFVIYTDYTPGVDVCEQEGSSNLWVVYTETGTAYPFDVIGTKDVGGKTEVLEGADLGAGMASKTVIHYGSGTSPGGVTAITNSSVNTLGGRLIQLPPPQGGRESWREIPLD